MTVRVKILILSAVLLLLFAVVLASSLIMQRHSSDKVAAIIEFQLPLAAAISDLDVATSDYELFLERMLRRNHDTPAIAEAEHQAARPDEGPHRRRLRARGSPARPCPRRSAHRGRRPARPGPGPALALVSEAAAGALLRPRRRGAEPPTPPAAPPMRAPCRCGSSSSSRRSARTCPRCAPSWPRWPGPRPRAPTRRSSASSA